MAKRTKLVYAVLLAVWSILVVWQIVEHDRVVNTARDVLINRSRDITTTLALVIRSQRRFGGLVSQERLESALKELIKPGDLSSVALFNSSGQIVASSGNTNELETTGAMQTGVRWAKHHVTVVNLVDLGMSISEERDSDRPTIVLPKRDPESEPRDSSKAPPPPGPNPENRTREEPGSNNRDRDRSRGRWGRPTWMDEDEYKAMLEKRGLHGLFITMSTETFRRTAQQDIWLRWIIGGLASVSVVGLGLAWRNLVRSAELQMRLLRASELNSHLKDMNLAAAGLAHETRNPLNIIRGLAQIISKQDDASNETRARSIDIVNETDRVTAQLNEFINYSRPRQVRLAPVVLGALVGEVVRALHHDLEEKSIQLDVATGDISIEADEQLLRQALFNLLFNAIQAVEAKGQIQVKAAVDSATGTILEVRDNGPGVPVDKRTEIFKPYFTTHQKGTGLGLTVVQQIVLAHGWEIVCLSNEPSGAVFRITHLKLATARSEHAA